MPLIVRLGYKPIRITLCNIVWHVVCFSADFASGHTVYSLGQTHNDNIVKHENSEVHMRQPSHITVKLQVNAKLEKKIIEKFKCKMLTERATFAS